MYAINADELRKLLNENPEAIPSTFLMDSSFAAECYDKKSVKWLKSAFNRDADPEECETWRLTPVEWKENIEMALMAKLASEKKRN